MTRYQYEAISPSGETIRGEIDAPSRKHVIDQLLADRHTPLSAKELSAGQTLISALLPSATRKFGSKHLSGFTQRLATLLGAGVRLERALALMDQTVSDAAEAQVIASILEEIRSGKSFAKSLNAAKVFPDYYISLASAGEASGGLSETIHQLAEQLERSAAFNGKVQSALIYPSLLLILIAATLLLLFGFVLPQFEQIFDRAGANLPTATRSLLAVGWFLTTYWWALLIGVLGIGSGARLAWQGAESRRKIDAWLFRTPFAFGIVRSAAMARFGRTLGLLLERRVAIGEALKLTGAAVGNRAFERALIHAADAVREGAVLSAAIGKSNMMPPLAHQLMSVGEETAELPAMLLKIGSIYERETEETLERVVAVLVPLITIVMGAIVASVIACVLVGVVAINDLAL